MVSRSRLAATGSSAGAAIGASGASSGSGVGSVVALASMMAAASEANEFLMSRALHAATDNLAFQNIECG